MTLKKCLRKAVNQIGHKAKKLDHEASRVIHQVGKQADRTFKQLLSAAKSATEPKQMLKSLLTAAMIVFIPGIPPSIAAELSNVIVSKCNNDSVKFKDSLRRVATAEAMKCVQTLADIPDCPFDRAVIRGAGNAMVAVANKQDPIKAFVSGAAGQVVNDQLSALELSAAEEIITRLLADVAIAAAIGEENPLETPLKNLMNRFMDDVTKCVEVHRKKNAVIQTWTDAFQEVQTEKVKLASENSLCRDILKARIGLEKLPSERDHDFFMRKCAYRADEYKENMNNFKKRLDNVLKKMDAINRCKQAVDEYGREISTYEVGLRMMAVELSHAKDGTDFNLVVATRYRMPDGITVCTADDIVRATMNQGNPLSWLAAQIVPDMEVRKECDQQPLNMSLRERMNNIAPVPYPIVRETSDNAPMPIKTETGYVLGRDP